MESDFSINLVTYRSDVDAWTRRSRMREERVGQWLVSMAGSALLAYGTYRAARRSWHGAWWIASGAALIGYAAAEFMKANGRGWRRDSEHADVVTLESLDSFPASDAPSSNATTTIPRPLDGPNGR
jgi:hypothetical protein